MADNFRISVHRNSENVHLKLMGDLDRGSAYLLLNMIKRNCQQAQKVFIHTNCLGHIDPFGRDALRHGLGGRVGPGTLIVTGEKAGQVSPQTG
jgi:hypothetical protein